MTLRERRVLFSRLISELVLWIDERDGYETAYDEVKRTQYQADAYAQEGKGSRDSEHLNACAGDLIIYRNGAYLMHTSEYKFAGDKWESLHPNNRWGGRYSDGNHFETLGCPR